MLVASPERLLGRPREMCNSLHPARVDALSEGAGTPKVPPEPAKGRREDPVPSTEENLARFEGAPWAFGARFSVPRTASTATFRSSRYQLGSHPFPGELAAKLFLILCGSMHTAWMFGATPIPSLGSATLLFVLGGALLLLVWRYLFRRLLFRNGLWVYLRSS